MITAIPSSMEGICNFNFSNLLLGYDPTFLYSVRGHMDRGKIYNHLRHSSSPKRIAIAKRLVNWFGGYVIYQDSYGKRIEESGKKKISNVYCDKRSCPVDGYQLIPDDGTSWDRYQKSLYKMQPLTVEEIKECEKYSAYKDD